MTSHLIDTFAKRAEGSVSTTHWHAENPTSTKSDTNSRDDCPFCGIIQQRQPAHRLYENEHVIAILDILPIRKGHVLVIPKVHEPRLSELPDDVAGHLGKAVSKVANALAKALDNNGLNVVCNQEYAQAVPHVHYHIVPAPVFVAPTIPSDNPGERQIPPNRLSSEAYGRILQAEFDLRGELESDDGAELARLIRAKL